MIRLVVSHDSMPAVPDAAIATGEYHERNIASVNCIKTYPDDDITSGADNLSSRLYFAF